MKITDVKTYELAYPVQEPFANSRVWCKTRNASLVEIQTDAGITGWGEGQSTTTPKNIQAHLIGADPFDYEVICRAQQMPFGGDFAAISAIDIALWDIVGKALDQPIYKLLGGAFRDRIPAYASGLFKKDRPDVAQMLADEAKSYVDQGFPAVKMKIGLGENYDVPNIAAVRRALGDDVLFAVDANCAYDVGTAIDIGQKIAPYDIYWYEEPIPIQDVKGYCELRQALDLRIAGGEFLQGHGAFLPLLQERGLDIVQPDLCIAGGFTECRKVQAMASAHRIRLLPHMWGTAIRLAATLHWQATLPDDPHALYPPMCLFEFDMTENGLRTDLAQEPICANDGYVPVPQQPGLGIEINRDVLEKYTVNYT